MSLYPLDNNLRQKKIYRVTFLYFFFKIYWPPIKVPFGNLEVAGLRLFFYFKAGVNAVPN